MDLTAYIRDIPDFPVPGIIFRDITPMLADPAAFRHAVGLLAERTAGWGANKVCAAEARGFLFAAALAHKEGLALVPARKPGKLPWKTRSASYALEYGTAELLVHEDAFTAGDKVLLLDDLLATGGTAAAMIDLCRQSGAEVAGLAFVIELPDLNGRDKLAGYPVESLIAMAGD